MTVVVGVDTSSTARRAAAKAARLAAGLDTDLVVVCAYSMKNSSGPSVPALETTTRERALAAVEDVAEELRGTHADLTIHTEAESGKPADVLLETARSVDAEVVVVGNRHVQGVSRILGSVAQDVVRRATCDVLVAHTS